ncbi:MAG: DUF1990 domain-containing protein [Proteobacteria bacterium]|nr:DUF1990 domain-containing protein [Pseudomonadota bacterium]
MIRIRPPAAPEITAHLASRKDPLSYSEAGATARLATARSEAHLDGYQVDRHEFPLGTGRERFERARTSLVHWRHLEIPWLEFHGASGPAREGQVVATLTPAAGLWFLNPCRVVYTELEPDERDIAAFAYGTLPGHVERGEERFQVSLDPSTEEVRYEILAFSRPARLISKLGYPFVRRLQKHFARSSAEALTRAVNEDDAGDG